MRTSWLRHEPWWYAGALLLALMIRFAALGTLPLNDEEAAIALQALRIANGQTAVLADAPGYSLLTAAVFYLFGDGNTQARLLPALLGALLPLAPLLYRQVIGRPSAAILAVLLAVEPGLVALSRTAGGAMMAVSLAVLALGFLLARRPIWAGLLLGLALLGGSTFWAVLLPAAAAWAFVRWNQPAEALGNAVPLLTWNRDSLVRFGAALAGSLLLGGTLFFLAPEGLSGLFNGLSVYLRSWVRPGSLPIVPAILALVLYHPASFLFGMGQGVSGGINGRRVEWGLLIFTLAALLQALLMPGRSFGLLLWVVLPLAVLAARRLSSPLLLDAPDRVWMWVEAALIGLLILYAYLSFISGQQNFNPQEARTLWIASAGALALVAVTVVLVAWGWSRRVAAAGAVVALAVTLYAYQFGAAVQAGGMGQKPANQLWRAGGVVDADLILRTLNDFSLTSVGNTLELEVSAAEIDSPALAWALRSFSRAEIWPVRPVQETPAVIITPQSQEPALAAEYRGQDFIWSSQPEWEAMNPGQWARWFFNRQAPVIQQPVILWARTDLFIDQQARGN